MRAWRPVQVLAVWLAVTPLAAAAQETPFTGPSLHAFLFGDMVYAAGDSVAGPGFHMGQVVGHGNARLSEQVSFFGEVSVTAGDGGYAFEVERAILRYDFSDALKLSLGRYHTPISYWNTAYHHGLWLQTSVARPEMIRIGGAFLPVHFIGAVAEGTLSSRALTLMYEAGVGNGRSSNIRRAGDAGDSNNSRALVATARLRPTRPFGLQLGGSIYLDKVGSTDPVDERIVSAHVAWDRGAPELIAEYARTHHDAGPAGSATSDGYYIHAGHRLPGALSAFKPYARWEDLDIAAADPVFAGQLEDYRARLAGLRWDVSPLAALKAEYRRESVAGGDWLNSIYLQAAFAVPLMGGM